MSLKQKVGALGEDLVEMFLVKRGYTILDRNFRRQWGELDVVARKRGKLHFIEVKSLTGTVLKQPSSVTHETSQEKARAYIRSGLRKDRFRPEDHMTREKVLRLGRIIQTYLHDKSVSSETPWQFDVAAVVVDEEGRRAKIHLLEDLPL